MQNNNLVIHTYLALCLCVCVCVFLSFLKLRPRLTLKSHKVAGLLGLPSDDADAALQTQDALNAEKYKQGSDTW